MTSTSTDAGLLSLSTGIRALTPFAREDAASYALSAALAVAGCGAPAGSTQQI